MEIVEQVLGKKPLLAPAQFFREFEPERCCATCRFIHYYCKEMVWQCARPNMESFMVSVKSPRRCICDAWYVARWVMRR